MKIKSDSQSIEEIIAEIQTLEADHEPDGWPAVQMKQLTLMADLMETQHKMIKFFCMDWADDFGYVYDLAKKLGVPQDQLDGDSYGVPGITEIVDMIVALKS